jgi:hypothetical protein
MKPSSILYALKMIVDKYGHFKNKPYEWQLAQDRVGLGLQNGFGFCIYVQTQIL